MLLSDWAWTEPQRRPHVIDGDLPDRLDAPAGQRASEDIPVEIGAKLAGLDIEALIPALYAAFYDSVAAHSRQGLNVVADVGHHDA